MINLRSDLFARLVISAHKNKHLNAPFHVRHVEFSNSQKRSQTFSEPKDTISIKTLEDQIACEQPRKVDVQKNVILTKTPEKIDEKVEKIVNDNGLIEIQIELEFAEQLLKKVKETDMHNPKIPIIEQTIKRLKDILGQKICA